MKEKDSEYPSPRILFPPWCLCIRTTLISTLPHAITMKRGPENPHLIALARALTHASGQSHAPVWKRVAQLLLRPKRSRVTVNLAKLSAYARANDVIVVPGRILSVGNAPTIPLTLAAESASAQAKKKLSDAHITLLSIHQLIEKHPDGSKIRIII